MSEYTPDEFSVRMEWVTNGIGTDDNLNAEFDRFIAKVKAEANAALAERVADYADATYDLIDSPNGARLAFEYIVAMIRGEVDL